jgi:hypothetical protein
MLLFLQTTYNVPLFKVGSKIEADEFEKNIKKSDN